jgi:hypothetical protein
METCLQTACLEYECSLSGKNEEILTVTGDKKVIHALADLLAREGLSMKLVAEVNKSSTFFEAEKPELHRPNSEKDESTFTCTMQ